MTDPAEIDIDIPGLSLAGLAWGPPDGEPVLALHGWLDNAASFTALAPLLPGCRVVAVDFPGHGRSQHRAPGARYHFIDYVADAGAMLDALGWDAATLLGHSLGGAAASILAGALPGRVRRLVLVEALGPLPAKPGEAPEQFARAWRGLQGLAAKHPPVYPDVAAALAARVRATGMRDDSARPIVERGLRPVAGGLTWRTDRRLTVPSLQRLAESQVREYLAAIRSPTLLVAAGGGSPVLGTDVLRGRARCVSSLELCTLGGGHHLHLDDASAVAGVIRPFLARAAADSPSC